MKRNFFALCTVVITVIGSSFSVKFTTDFYAVYKQVGVERNPVNYNYFTTPQTHLPGTGKLNWLKVVAASSSGPTTTEFLSAFDALDITPLFPGPNQLLSDEVDVTGILDVRN
jgi:hypothetical protein